MKSGVLLSKLADEEGPITKDRVLHAIRDLNAEVVQKFGQDARVVELRAADFKKTAKWHSHVPVCENTLLSLEGVGQAFKAFMIDHDDTKRMHSEQIDFLQGVIANYMDLNEWAPPNLTKTKEEGRLVSLQDKAEKVKRHAEPAC